MKKESSRWRKKSPPRKPRRVVLEVIDELVIRLTPNRALTVAGQRRIFTDFPNNVDYEVVGAINHL